MLQNQQKSFCRHESNRHALPKSFLHQKIRKRHILHFVVRIEQSVMRLSIKEKQY